MDETGSRLTCHHLSLPFARLSKALIHFESATDLLLAEPTYLARFFREEDIRRVAKWRLLSASEQENEISLARATMQVLGAAILSITDQNYPTLLREIPDPPALLSVIGDAQKLLSPQIAIVGSRKMTPLGGKLAEDFSRDLGRAGITITSGLALGIDTCAHRGALSAGASTIAVLGTGLDVRYPKTNHAIYDHILESGGVLVSEYPIGTPPKPENFPRRNRIITGLSMGTLVVEASERSGSLVSARLAAEQGREVFVVPGNVYSPASEGCHTLIRNGATLVTKPEHITQDLEPMLGLVFDTQPETKEAEITKNALDEHWLLAALGHECLSIDELCDRCEKPVQAVMAAITNLEITGSIAASAFGYQRCR